MKEKDIQLSIVSWLERDMKALVYKLTTYGPHGRMGWPDLLILLPGGTVIFREIKTPTGKLTPIQFRVHERIILQGGDVGVWKSLEEAKEEIG